MNEISKTAAHFIRQKVNNHHICADTSTKSYLTKIEQKSLNDFRHSS